MRWGLTNNILINYVLKMLTFLMKVCKSIVWWLCDLFKTSTKLSFHLMSWKNMILIFWLSSLKRSMFDESCKETFLIDLCIENVDFLRWIVKVIYNELCELYKTSIKQLSLWCQQETSKTRLKHKETTEPLETVS